MTDSLISQLSLVNRSVATGESRIQPLHHRSRWVYLQHEIAQITATNTTPEVAVLRLATALAQAFHAEGCWIAYSASGASTTSVVGWLAKAHGVVKPPIHVPTNVTTWNIGLAPTVFSNLSRRPASVPTGSAEEQINTIWQLMAHPSDYLPMHHVLSVATQFQGEVNGVVSVLKSAANDGSNSDVELMSAVSWQLGLTLSQLQLHYQMQKKTRCQAVVNQLVRVSRTAGDLNDILKTATDGTAQALQVSRSLLLRLKYWDPLVRGQMVDQIPRVRVTVACEWLNPATVDGRDACTDLNEPSPASASLVSILNQSFALADCDICQQAFAHAPELTIINHAATGYTSSLLCPPALPALLIAPLESNGTLLGFLVLQDHQFRSWEPDDIELVELVSAQISTAIIQTETLRQVKSLVDKRTAELKQSLAVQARLYERTRQQLDQLRRLNHLKDEFVSTISHELRTPLTSMSLAIRMLRQAEPPSERASRYLDILEQQCAQETNLINDLLALQEVESKQTLFQVQNVDLGDLLQSLCDSFAQKWATKGLTLVFQVPQQAVVLQSDRDSLSRVLLELLSNAGKYSDPGTKIHLQVDCQQAEPVNQVCLTLHNIGAGIPADELPHIFDKFRRCQTATRNAIQGTGLGLALVKSLVQHLNGAIIAESYPIPNSQSWKTSFLLTLPQSVSMAKF